MTFLDLSLPRFTHVAVTLRLADPASDLLIRQIALLRDCVALGQHRFPFEIDTACVLPAELQMLCHLPDGDDMAPRLRLIRSAFARHATDRDSAHLWERSGEQAVVPVSGLDSRRAFILNAPVRAGLVLRPEDWAYSSLHRRGAPQPIVQVA